jgi:uncharacterized protein (TIGR00645 family)
MADQLGPMTVQSSARAKSPIEAMLERGLFAARWVMAPFYLGLVAALVLLMAVFARELVEGASVALHSPEQAILLALSLIDLSLAGNLILIVTLSGYENFVSKIDTRGNEDRPEWMGTIDFSAMKIKLIGSIVAISAISLLRSFMQLSGAGEEAAPGVRSYGAPPDQRTLAWMVGLHVTFIISGVLFALMDWMAEKSHALSAHSRAD